MRRTVRKKKAVEEPEVRQKQKAKQRHSFTLKARTQGQQEYADSIERNTVTLCSGFAGTGKTLIAIGKAMQLLQDGDNKYSKIIVVRPAVEACGESIGFLPGGINDKMRPLIQPVIDNLRYFIKDEGYITKLIDGGVDGAPLIEVIPMAYLRGRTFNNCIVVFDEAQNASPQQVKLFLTRIGDNCKVIIEGDITQSDKFRRREDNGLADAMNRLEGLRDVGVVVLGYEDIQRSKIIGPILAKYQDIDGL